MLLSNSLEFWSSTTFFKTMARVLLALSSIFCLYFLIVCVLTHGQAIRRSGASMFALVSGKTNAGDDDTNEKPMTAESVNFKYEPEVIPEALLVHQDPEDKTDVRGRQPKSAPLESNGQRYLVMDSNNDNGFKNHQTNKNDDDDETYRDCTYHLAFTLIERNSNEHLYASKLMNKFSNTLSSILLNINSTNMDQGSLCVHLITDDLIRPHLRRTIAQVHEDLAQKSQILTNMPHMRHAHLNTMQWLQHRPLTRYFFIDSTAIGSRLEYLLPTLRTFFTHKLNSYYSNALFFYSLVLHQVIPSKVADRLILLDVDVQLDANILELFELFNHFKPEEVIGIAYEQQPVYRHILHEYRRDNPDTMAGSPPPNGFPGYNSGVLLLHLRKMRQSKVYQGLLNPLVLAHLCQKYRFRGHLGDQDFYTLVAIEHRSLFHTLPCGWNRQLCQWWRFHGYGKVFDDYHRCQDASSASSTVKLYHGNCNSALPTLTYYGDYRRRR